MTEWTPKEALEALPEHLREALRPHPLLQSVTRAPCRVFVGFCEPLAAPGGVVRVRVYLNVGLREAIEVAADDIVYAQRLGGAGSLEATVLWVAATAQVTRVELPGIEAGTPLLHGEISEDYLARYVCTAVQPLFERAPEATPPARAAMRGGEIRPTYDCG